ncbi:DUF885 domain-containing protein [Sphingomonas koreensis]
MSGPVVSRRALLAGSVALVAWPGAAAASGEAARLDAFFEASFRKRIARNPLSQSGLGIKDGQGRWPDPGEARAAEDAGIVRTELAELARFDTRALDPERQLSVRLFDYTGRQALTAHRWRGNRYPVCQMRGPQRIIPQTLINNHPIADRADAEAYIARLRGVKPYLAAIVEGLDSQAAAGVLPPNFAYPLVIGNCAALIRGAPFGGTGDSPILADFREKIGKLEVGEGERARLVQDAEAAMRDGFGPGFQNLIAWLEQSQARMARNDGVWSLPEGDAYYRAALEMETTLPLTPQEVHRTGLEEVARLHAAMRAVMAKSGFNGSLTEFFAFVGKDDRFYYPNTPAGRAAYLDAMRGHIAAVEARLGEVMTRVPKAGMIVKPVEPWLERSAATAGYFAPTPDGSRPGILYVNTVEMRNLPKYELSALAFHEGVPGHHLERAISQELTHLPAFRRQGGYTAYSEGWALYAEQLPYAMGLYTDPYQEFGQLSQELMRAGRLVVDTGLHHLRWSRERAIDWLVANTPGSRADHVTAVQRYIVTPGQATAYEIGKLKMIELRERAEKTLGRGYDPRRFNDALMGSGPLPLALLDEVMTRWIANGGKA